MKAKSKIWWWNGSWWRMWFSHNNGMSDIGWEIDVENLPEGHDVFMHPIPVTKEGVPLTPDELGSLKVELNEPTAPMS